MAIIKKKKITSVGKDVEDRKLLCLTGGNKHWWLEKTLESPLDCKEIQPVHPKGDHYWVFTGGTDAEAHTARLWPPHAKSYLIGKEPDAGRD